MKNISRDEISILIGILQIQETEPAEILQRTRVCIHCSLRKQKMQTEINNR